MFLLIFQMFFYQNTFLSINRIAVTTHLFKSSAKISLNDEIHLLNLRPRSTYNPTYLLIEPASPLVSFICKVLNLSLDKVVTPWLITSCRLRQPIVLWTNSDRATSEQNPFPSSYLGIFTLLFPKTPFILFRALIAAGYYHWFLRLYKKVNARNQHENCLVLMMKSSAEAIVIWSVLFHSKQYCQGNCK